MHDNRMLGSILAPERNSFTLIRLAAASAVIVSHGFELTIGRNAPQPFSGVSPYNLGQHAVNAFFVLSGLTLAQSLAAKPDLSSFLVARLLRIIPGLIACGVMISFIAGPILTSVPLGEYFSSIHTYLYPLDASLRFADALPPPGIFATVPVAGVVNEPLWTIRYEMIAYVGLALLAAIGLFPSSTGVAAAFVCMAALFAITEAFPGIIEQAPFAGSLTRFGLCFMIGVAAFVLRERIVLSYIKLALFFGLVLLFNNTVVARAANLSFIAYLVFVLGSGRYGAIGRWTRQNDISYGTYLYGWPIQQTLMGISPGMSAAWNIGFALVIAPAAGFISWRFVESPALTLKSRRRGVHASHNPANLMDAKAKDAEA